MIADQIGDAGEIAILSATANATNQNAWIDVMKKELAEPPEDQAGGDGVRRRRRPEVLRQDRRAAAEAPEPEGHHLAHDGRHRGGCSLPVDLGLQGQGRADRSRHAQPDARVRQGRHRQRSSRSGTPRTSATSRPTPRTRWSRATSRAKRATASRPASSATSRSAPTARCSSATRSSSTPTTSTSSSSESDEFDDSAGEDRQRVCFQLQVRPDRLEEYTARHSAVWPDMLRALSSTGWHNYSLFLREDGLLIGYFETPDLQAALDGMDAHRGQRPLAGRDGGVLRRPR